MGEQIVAGVAALLTALTRGFLEELGTSLATYVLHTPDIAHETSLREYWFISLAALFACSGLLVALAGAAYATGRGSRLGQAARESLGLRLPGCVLTASVSLPLVGLEVELANRLVDLFVQDGFLSQGNPLARAMQDAIEGDVESGLALLLTVTVGVLLLVVLLVLSLARWATLWLLVVLAPLAMGFALLPGGAGLAQLWWRLQITAVFLPVLNAVLLGTYIAMFSSDTNSLTGALSGIAVLALMTKLPAWAAGRAADVSQGDMASRLHRARSTAVRAVHMPARSGPPAPSGTRGVRPPPVARVPAGPPQGAGDPARTT